jgi:hypothetical protein
MFNAIGADLQEEEVQLRTTEYALEKVDTEPTGLEVLGVGSDGDLVFRYVN